ncbi:kelch-like protein 12 [Anneissia japonica]|uniref:kelch-like protein 12 n=1 Tax=Anneissia japonica TaxID=1529436 RepID=UPI001425BAB5|nr:kelch-like protein 12 [Anneissia japonica]
MKLGNEHHIEASSFEMESPQLRSKRIRARPSSTTSHSKGMLMSMNELRKQELLCDVVLCVEKQMFPAHRIVMAASSDYFCAMFTGEMFESHRQQVELQGLKSSTMKILIEYIYTESIQITVENVQEVLPAACLLQLKGVEKSCCTFLENQLDPTNCLGIKHFAEMHSCLDLTQASLDYCHRHFQAVVKNDEFLALDEKEVEALVKSDDVHLGSEEMMFEALMSWTRHEKESRMDSLPRLLSHVRLPLLSPKYLTDTIDNEPLIKRNHECRDLIDEAKRFHLRPECRGQMDSVRTKPRTGADERLVVIGGFGSEQMPLSTVEEYNPKTDAWTFLPALNKRRRYVAAASLKDRLYVIGGYDGTARLNLVECLDCCKEEKAKWTRLSPMNTRRGLAGVTVIGDAIYVAGGFDGSMRHSSLEKYDPHIDRWNVLKEMENGREGAGLVSAGGVMYCIGGYDGFRILKSVEQFDPAAGQWHRIAPMLVPRSGAGVSVLNDMIYVIGGYDGNGHLSSVECYNPRTNTWRPVANMSLPRCYVGSVTLKGKLYAVSGYDGSKLLNTVEWYDPVKDVWETLQFNMDMQRCDAGVSVIRRF